MILIDGKKEAALLRDQERELLGKLEHAQKKWQDDDKNSSV